MKTDLLLVQFQYSIGQLVNLVEIWVSIWINFSFLFFIQNVIEIGDQDEGKYICVFVFWDLILIFGRLYDNTCGILQNIDIRSFGRITNHFILSLNGLLQICVVHL